MDYNRYRGNSGRVERVTSPAPPPGPPSPLPPPDETASPPEPERRRAAPGGAPPGGKTPSDALRGLRGSLDGILSRLDPGRLETEDLLVLAILWLLYRDSGDKELLIAMGAYLFL